MRARVVTFESDEECDLLDETAEHQVTVRVDADVLAWLYSSARKEQSALNGLLRQAMLDQRKSMTLDIFLWDALGFNDLDPEQNWLPDFMKMMDEWEAELASDPGDDSPLGIFMREVGRVADTGNRAVLQLQEDTKRLKDDPVALRDAAADIVSRLVPCLTQWASLHEHLVQKGLFQSSKKRQRPPGVVTVALAVARREFSRAGIEPRQIEAIERYILRREGGATTRAANPANAARRATQHRRQRATIAQKETC